MDGQTPSRDPQTSELMDLEQKPEFDPNLLSADRTRALPELPYVPWWKRRVGKIIIGIVVLIVVVGAVVGGVLGSKPKSTPQVATDSSQTSNANATSAGSTMSNSATLAAGSGPIAQTGAPVPVAESSALPVAASGGGVITPNSAVFGGGISIQSASP